MEILVTLLWVYLPPCKTPQDSTAAALYSTFYRNLACDFCLSNGILFNHIAYALFRSQFSLILNLNLVVGLGEWISLYFFTVAFCCSS